MTYYDLQENKLLLYLLIKNDTKEHHINISSCQQWPENLRNGTSKTEQLALVFPWTGQVKNGGN